MSGPEPPLDRLPAKTRSELEQVFADKIPSRVAGALIGFGIAGLPGAMVGAALSPPLEYILKEGNQRYTASAEKVIAEVAKSRT